MQLAGCRLRRIAFDIELRRANKSITVESSSDALGVGT